MTKNLNRIILLSIFFIIISVFFLIKNEKMYHQKIILNNIDDLEGSKIFQLKNNQGLILDISLNNLNTNIFSEMEIKILFSQILRSLQSNKIYRYEFKNYKNYSDKEFKYLQKILNNIELEGAYFLNPEQLADAIINLYANDLKRANKVFNEFYSFCVSKIIQKRLKEFNRIADYKNVLFNSFFNKYSLTLEQGMNNYRNIIVSFIENEKNFNKKNQKIPLIISSDNILNQFREIEKIITEYLSSPNMSKYQEIFLNIKKLEANQEFLKIKKDTEEIISKINIDEKNSYVKRRINFINSIEEFKSLLFTKETDFFHVLKEDLIEDTISFRLNILNDKQIYEKFDLKDIKDKRKTNEIITTIKDIYYLKKIYDNLLVKEYQVSLRNNLKTPKLYENMKVNEDVYTSYFFDKMTIVVEKLNLIYFFSLILFSIISSVVIVGVSHSFKKNI